MQANKKPVRYDTIKPRVENFDQRLVVYRKQSKVVAMKSDEERSGWDVCLDYLLCKIGMQTNDLDIVKDEENRFEINVTRACLSSLSE